MSITRFTALFLLLICSSPPAWSELQILNRPLVNGHPGYQTAWNVEGDVDKVLLIVPGFDIENTSPPEEELTGDLAGVAWLMGLAGWEVIYFEYVDGAMDLRANADNLARFIEYVDSVAVSDYHLAVVGGSMGGIVARTMFAQENHDMGVDTYVSIDAPHRGVMLSRWVENLAEIALDYPAAHQMNAGDPAFEELYGWLSNRESSGYFRNQVLGPMNTCAISLSDGASQSWDVKWEDELLHNEFLPVSSYFEAASLRSTYMPYHSTAFLDNTDTYRKWRWGENRYRYQDLSSSYFDENISNARDEHGAPMYAIIQALQFIWKHGPDGS